MNLRKDALVDSLIALQRQAEMLQALISEGQKKWAGENTENALHTTCKAMLYDVGKLQDIEGASTWSEVKRQYALGILKNN